MLRPISALLLAASVVSATGIAVVVPAAAQIKPESSGETSFNEPEMAHHRSGLVHPRRPHHHRHHHPYSAHRLEFRR